jgi:fucose permease
MKPNYPIVGLVFLIFMVIAVITNILGAIVPDVGAAFGLSKFLVGFLPLSFFLAYGVFSIPSGMLVEQYREKAAIAVAFGLALSGSLLFAIFPKYAVSLPSLFAIGVGMATLQVAINPLLRVAGGEQHFSFFSVMAQALFGLSSYAGPKIYSYLVQELQSGKKSNAIVSVLAGLVPKGMAWVSMYWVFAALAAAMVVIILIVRLPRVDRKDDERAGAWSTHVELFRDPVVRRFLLGIFCYVGTEQGVSFWISQFLKDRHGLDPQTIGADATGRFWFLMMLGCLLGLLLLKLMDQRKLLIGAAVVTMATLATGLFGSASVATQALPAVGFTIAVMWSVVFSLGMSSVSKHHGSMAGILCTGIAGGGIVPPIIGWIADHFGGLQVALLFIYLPLGYILSIGFWAKPLVNNATIFSAKKEAQAQAAAG